MSNDIIIESNLSQNENIPKKEIDKNAINSNEKGDINIIESKDIQTNNIEINNTENNEIEKDKINNSLENTQKLTLSLKEKDDSQININHLNDKNGLNEKKEKKQQNMDNNKEKNENNFEAGKKEENNLIPKIIDEEEEYSPIEQLLQEHKSKNNILKNNQIYFTEANTLGSRDYGDIRDIHKSSSNKLYTLTSIPEYSNIKIKNTAKTPMKIKPLNQKSKNINICLNNLSPEIYMKKKFTNNNKNEISSLKIRIKKIEEDLQKQNDYDYKSAMRDCKLKYIKDMKNKEKEKQIIEEHKKLEEKLKNMEEYRKNMINNKIKKILQRQKNRNKKVLDNSADNNIIDLGIKEKMEKINNEKIFKTLDSYEEKLPILPGMPKYEIIKMIKDKEEKDFCLNTEQRLKDLEKNHRKNYLKQLYIINDKLAKQNEIYNIRSEKCINTTKEKIDELEENYIEKEMIRRYNIKQNIIRELSEKKEKAKGNLIKNIENVKEKKELLIKQEQQKIKQILKRLNRKQKIDLKNNLINENINNHRIYFSNLQKENLNKANKEKKDYYNDLILRQEDYFWVLHDLQKDESSSKIIIQKKALEAQNKKDNEFKSLTKFKEMMDRSNINNQKGGTKMKIYLEQRRIEFENKNREEEEAMLENKK